MIAPVPAAEPMRPEEQSTAERGAEAREQSRAGLHADVVIAGLIIAFCAAMWAGTVTFEDVPAALAQGMGPAVFPRLILGIIAVLALSLAFASRGRPDAARDPVYRSTWVTLAAVLVVMGVLYLFGMYGAILFATIGIGYLWGERRLWLTITVGIGLAIVTYLFFVVAFKIPLPRAVFDMWLS